MDWQGKGFLSKASSWRKTNQAGREAGNVNVVKISLILEEIAEIRERVCREVQAHHGGDCTAPLLAADPLTGAPEQPGSGENTGKCNPGITRLVWGGRDRRDHLDHGWDTSHSSRVLQALVEEHRQASNGASGAHWSVLVKTRSDQLNNDGF